MLKLLKWLFVRDKEKRYKLGFLKVCPKCRESSKTTYDPMNAFLHESPPKIRIWQCSCCNSCYALNQNEFFVYYWVKVKEPLGLRCTSCKGEYAIAFQKGQVYEDLTDCPLCGNENKFSFIMEHEFAYSIKPVYLLKKKKRITNV